MDSKTDNNFYIVLMAGGSGTRLWPMSRKNLPKQFQKFSGEKSLIQETYDRVKDLAPKENIYVSLVANILKNAQEQLKDIPKNNFIIEPEAKNTGPAIGLDAVKILKNNPDALVATIASDHTIRKTKNFRKAILQAKDFVEKNPEFLMTIGIKPNRPDTGFGYIEMGKTIEGNIIEVKKFVEKPSLDLAKRYLKSGKYLWNASYFIFKATTLLEMFKTFQKDIYDGLMKIYKSLGGSAEKEVLDKEYAKFPKVPIDTAIAEKVEKIAVIPTDLDWSDVGSWASLYDILSKKEGNHTISQGQHIGVGDRNCLIYARRKLLATVGLEDIIIVDTPDVTLVCNKNKSQDVKQLIDKLKEEGKSKYL